MALSILSCLYLWRFLNDSDIKYDIFTFAAGFMMCTQTSIYELFV